MNRLNIIKFAICTIICSSSAIAQQEQPLMLELPDEPAIVTKSKPAKDTNLELLSPDELTKLYANEGQTVNEPIAATPEKTVEPVISETAIKTPPTAESEKEDKKQYDTLQEELENETEDLSPGRFDINKIWSYQSVMLLPNEVKIFNTAISRYIKSLNAVPVTEGNIEEYAPEETAEAGPAPILGDYPIITLDSIMYINKDNWSAWINGTRFTSQKTNELAGLSIDKISKHTIDIHWQKPSEIEVIPEENSLADVENPFVVKEEIIEIENEEPEKPLPDNVKRIDEENYIITLKPGQAFLTDDLEIHEGRVMNARISEIYQEQLSNRDAPASSNVATSTETENPATVSQAKRDEENIAKLLELYKESGIGTSE